MRKIGLRILWPLLCAAAAAQAGDITSQEDLFLERDHAVAVRRDDALQLKLGAGSFVLATRHYCGDLLCPTDDRRYFRFDHYDAATGRHFVRMNDGGTQRIWLRIGACGEVDTASEPNQFRAPPPAQSGCTSAVDQWRAQAKALDESEKTAIPDGGRVRRDGDRLTLALADGRSATFTQHWLCGDFRCPAFLETTYRFSAHLAAAGQYLVERRGRSMVDWLMVDERSGTLVQARSYPIAAPDGRHLASIEGDILRNLFRIEIWEVTAEGLKSVFLAEPRPGEGVAFVAWEGPDRIRLHTFNSLPEGGYEPAYLERTEGGWKLVRPGRS